MCPVYERTGGQAYGSVYPGPIGTILARQLVGDMHDEHAASLPYASSLCGACFEVCPVRIDIPSVLVDQRAQVVDAHRGGVPKPEAMAMKGAAYVLGRSHRLSALERLTGLGMRFARRFGPTAWIGARDLPDAPGESFRDWWQRTDGGRKDDA